MPSKQKSKKRVKHTNDGERAIDQVEGASANQAPEPEKVVEPTKPEPNQAIVPISRRTGTINKYVDNIHNDVLESLGTKDELQRALTSTTSPKAAQLLSLLVNPLHKSKSIISL
jgi:hypothetical protein